MNQQDPPLRSKEALAAAVRSELSKPIIPGEILPMDGEIEAFKGREIKAVTVTNMGDRPIQIGSHYHFFESNRALKLDREQAFGFGLAIPAGASVRFGPEEEKTVTLVAFGGNCPVQGMNGLTEGSLNDPSVKAKAVVLAKKRGFEEEDAR
ncbi:MAG: urease subunit beta [Nitrospira sp.]